MLHGKGSQAILTKTRESERQDALLDRTGLTAQEIITLELKESDGCGRTNPKTYEIKQNPFPMDSSIKSKEIIDIRKVRPELGEMSD
jgi:hypothetical protein